jgi:hypothetical protein
MPLPSGGTTRAGTLQRLDVGAGLRLDAPGLDGALNVDIAYGLNDGRVRLSATVRRAWPES